MIDANCFSIFFLFHDDIDYELLNRGMFQKNAESLWLLFQALVACNIVTLAHYSSFIEIGTLGYIMAYEEWAQTTIPCCE